MDYKKPQSTLVQGGAGIYPLTTADQVILADGSRLEKDGRISADSAANSAKLGGKAPEYYLQPRNLLDNSDFRNPVNQRGIVYGANRNNGYTIDRWHYEQSAGAGDGYFGLTEYYVSLLAPSDGYSQMYQNLEKYAKLKGKNVTFAALINRGGTEKIACVTFTLGSVGVGLKLFEDGSLKLYSIDGMNIVIRATGTEEFQFIWAALYEGTYTADTLPPYIPKGYAAELAECQRYFRKGAQAVTIGTQYGSGSLFSLSVPSMRIKPTVTLIEISSQGWGNVAASNYTLEWNGDLGSSFYVNYIYSVSDDVGKTVVVFYEMSADL